VRNRARKVTKWRNSRRRHNPGEDW
ncbi:MAG: hypothetical protein QG597_2732, partial [Actinomycetota bacterium]|nr:hypothetical protein [Actinomycetota bacterium]